MSMKKMNPGYLVSGYSVSNQLVDKEYNRARAKVHRLFEIEGVPMDLKFKKFTLRLTFGDS